MFPKCDCICDFRLSTFSIPPLLPRNLPDIEFLFFLTRVSPTLTRLWF